MDRTISLDNLREQEIYSQQTIDYDKNILIRIYKINFKNKICFAYRFYSHDNELQDLDPLTNSNFNWAYGLYNTPDECFDSALNQLNSTYLTSMSR